MEVLTFDIAGKFAHFRKYYSNNTALSFSIPPRTTLIGIIASALGLQRDSYYEDMVTSKLRIGIMVLCPIKKTFHRLNHLKVESGSDLRGTKGHIQLPYEVISGLDITKDEVTYRIFISCFEEGRELFNKITDAFLQKKFIYNLSLGAANFSANIKNTRLITGVLEKEATNEFMEFHSAINSNNVKEIDFKKSTSSGLSVEEELIPIDFKGNNDRELTKITNMLFSVDGRPLTVIQERTYFEYTENNSTVRFQFME